MAAEEVTQQQLATFIELARESIEAPERLSWRDREYIARALLHLDARLKDVLRLRPEAEYHEDFGDVLWWRLPIEEPPYVGRDIVYEQGEGNWWFSLLPKVWEGPGYAAALSPGSTGDGREG